MFEAWKQRAGAKSGNAAASIGFAVSVGPALLYSEGPDRLCIWQAFRNTLSGLKLLDNKGY